MGSSGAPRLRSRLRNTLVMMVKSQAFSFVPGLKRFRYRYARKYVSCTRSSASSGFLVRRSALRYSASRCLSKSEKSLLMPTPRWSILFRRISARPEPSALPRRPAWTPAWTRTARPWTAPSTTAPAALLLARARILLLDALLEFREPLFHRPLDLGSRCARLFRPDARPIRTNGFGQRVGVGRLVLDRDLRREFGHLPES